MIRIPIDDGSGHVIEVDFRPRSATFRRSGECFHRRIVIDPELSEIECTDCKAKLNPLKWIENQVSVFRWFMEREREASLTIQAANLRTRTKCRHCGQMTPVRVSAADVRRAK